MGVDQFINTLAQFSFVPSGAVNVRIGTAVEGPGGRWIPCATALAEGAYIPCVYEVGSGRRQVCGASNLSPSEDEAFSRAVELALTASA